MKPPPLLLYPLDHSTKSQICVLRTSIHQLDITFRRMSDIDDDKDSFDEFDREFEIRDNDQQATFQRLAVV